MTKTKISKEQKKANKQATKSQKKANRIAKRDARMIKIAKFFDLKFLRTKKYIAIKRNRASLKALLISILWAIPFVLGIAGAPLAALLIVIAYLFAPKVWAPLVARYKERYAFAIERAEAYQIYINKRQERVTAKQAKKHSKWSKKGNKGRAKNAKLDAKNKAKEAKRASKEKAKTDSLKTQSNVFVGAIKEAPKVHETNATLK